MRSFLFFPHHYLSVEKVFFSGFFPVLYFISFIPLLYYQFVCISKKETSSDQWIFVWMWRSFFLTAVVVSLCFIFSRNFDFTLLLSGFLNFAFICVYKKHKKKGSEISQEKALAEKKKEKLAVLGQFVASVAHELRNPLSAIRSGIYYLKNKRHPDKDTLEKYLTLINEELNIAHSIINNILETIKTPNPIKISILLEEIINDIFAHDQDLKNQIDIRMHFKSKTRFIFVDPVLLRQVLLNLLTNSRDVVSPSGQKAFVDITLSDSKHFYMIEYTDNGPGIKEDMFEKIFDPFFTTKKKGTGLGLWMCKQIIESLDAKIQAGNFLGKGAFFQIQLPKEPENNRLS